MLIRVDAHAFMRTSALERVSHLLCFAAAGKLGKKGCSLESTLFIQVQYDCMSAARDTAR